MTDAPPTGTRLTRNVAGYLISLGLLIWVFHNIDFGELLRDLKSMSPWWIVPAVGFDICSYYCQGLRWKFLLRPFGPISSMKTTQAVYAGLFTNELLPLRIGEAVRTFLVSRWMGMPFVSVIPTLIVERFFDGLWLALAVAVVALFVPLPKNLIEGEMILIGIILLVLAAFIWHVYRRQRAVVSAVERAGEDAERRWRPVRRIRTIVQTFADGVSRIGLSGNFFVSLFISLVVLVLQVLSLWMMMLAYGIHLDFMRAATVLLIMRLGTAIPNAPSNAGSYQFFAVLGLMLFGVDKTTAAGFSVAAFLILTIPLWALGIAAINRTGMTLRDIRGEIRNVRV
jgi:uncharacterized protein (TIRG00374 family)